MKEGRNEVLKVKDGVVYFKLTKNKIGLCDIDDWENIVSKHRYQAHHDGNSVKRGTNTFYIRRCQKINGKLKTIYVHHDILGKFQGKEVDHVNRNPLDNRRVNIRIVTRSANQRNSHNNKGLCPDYWSIAFTKQGYYQVTFKKKYMGIFKTEKDALNFVTQKSEKLKLDRQILSENKGGGKVTPQRKREKFLKQLQAHIYKGIKHGDNKHKKWLKNNIGKVLNDFPFVKFLK